MFDWQALGTALALVFILEALLPFASPRDWRQALLRLAAMNDRQIRTGALLALSVGLFLLYVFR